MPSYTDASQMMVAAAGSTVSKPLCEWMRTLVSDYGNTLEVWNAHVMGDLTVDQGISAFFISTASLITTGGNIVVNTGTPPPAGGGAATSLIIGANGPGVYSGTGVPTVSAKRNSVYIRTDGTTPTTRIYVNTDGATTWTNLTAAA